MNDQFKPLRDATSHAVLHSKGTTPIELRRAIAAGNPPPELATLVEKIRSRAYTVTDEDLDGLRTRYSDNQLFEIIVSASVGAASERLAAARKALEEA